MLGAAGASGNPFAQFVGGAIQHFTVSPTNALAGITLNSDGSVSYNGSGPGGVAWFTPTSTGIGSSYWVRATLNSGSLSAGTTGSVLSLSAGQSWSRNRTTIGSSAANITLEIFADAGGTQLMASATFSMLADMS